MPTNTEVMRDKLIKGCDDIIDAGPLASRFITREQRRLAKALRTYWQQTSSDVLDAISALYDAEPVRAAEPHSSELVMHGHYRHKDAKPGEPVYSLIDLAWDRSEGASGGLAVILYSVWKPSSYVGGETVCVSEAEFLRDFEEIPAYPDKGGAEPVRAEDASEPEPVGAVSHPGWLPGPLPKGTWNWGGVVPVGQKDPSSGFYFADFHGDHALVEKWEKVGEDEGVYKITKSSLEADQIAWWNNSLCLPPTGKGRVGGDDDPLRRSLSVEDVIPDEGGEA